MAHPDVLLPTPRLSQLSRALGQSSAWSSLSLKPSFPFLPQVRGDSSKQLQALVQMHFQGLHLYTTVVYDFAQGCQVPSGIKKPGQVLGSGVA